MKKVIITIISVLAITFGTSANASAQVLTSVIEEAMEEGASEEMTEEELMEEAIMLAEEDDIRKEELDSLLTIWYHQLKVGQYDEDITIDDSLRFTSNVSDSVFVERLKKMNSFITLPYNETVKNYMILYSEKMPEKMAHMLSLSTYYFPIFEEIFNKYDMPEELKMMAIIESSLNPVARSKAGARGIWQFMHSTGKLYGLKINSFVDERLDPVKAAEAAAHYLMDSYAVFGDWALAISSYNCGAGNVNKAIRRSGHRDFWGLYPYLPRETRGYVPAFVGALYAFTYYKEYGIVPEPVAMPAVTDTFEINQNLHFKQISEVIDIPVETLRNLNPQYVHDIVPGNEATYILKLPYNYSGAFVEMQDSIYRYKADSLISQQVLKRVADGGDGERVAYKVKSGDTLGKIAGKYHVTVSQLKKWNNLKNDKLRIGQTIYVYDKNYTGGSSSTSSTAAKTAADGTYTVVAGDTLNQIAVKFGTTVAAIKQANNLTSNNIKVGQKLAIPAGKK